MIKALLCDLDGTLLSTTKDIKLALETALGSTFEDREVDRFVGNGLRNAVRAALRCKGCTEKEIEEKTDGYYDRLIECYEKVPVKYTVPFEGINEMLTEASRMGIRIGIFSNKQQSILDKVVSICLCDYDIDFVIGRGGKYRAKPDPEAVFAFCEHVGCTKDELVYLGDSEVDYNCARSAGVRALIFDWGTRSREELISSGVPLDCIIRSAGEVLEVIR